MPSQENAGRHPRYEYNKAYRVANRERCVALSKPAKDRYAASERGRYMKRTNQRAKRYGLTRDELLELIGRPCAICASTSDHIDHDHVTGRIRGMLCGRATRGLACSATTQST